jgi:hypothetical protein
MEMMGGALGAVGSIAGAFIQADAQKYAANTNYSIALMNYYQRERERTQARLEAQRLERKQDLGMTDIEGTKTKFTPGLGWQTTPTAQKQALMNRQQTEQMAQFGDTAMKRRQVQANVAQQAQERDKARALFDEMGRTTSPSAGEIERVLLGAQGSASNRAFDDTLQVGARQALRTGANPSKIFSEIARARSQEERGMAGQAKLQGMQLAPQLEDQDQKMKANLYNLFATRASAAPDVSFSPVPLDSGAAAGAMKSAGASGEMAVKAAMMEGGRMPFVPPMYGMANAVGATGMALQGLTKNASPYFNEGGGGYNLWGAMNDQQRLRGGSGSFAGAP